MAHSSEIARLREQVETISRRHIAELDAIRSQIFELESRSQRFQNSEPEVSSPPPLPKAPAKPAGQNARPDTSSDFSDSKIQTPKAAESDPPRPPNETFELDFARVWFVRVGMVILLTGLVFLGNYAYQNWVRELSNGTRLLMLFLCAVGLSEAGRQLAKRENLNRFGEVLLAGGMAFFYYCTFAAHHVTRLKVIESPALGTGLLFLSAGGIAAVSWFRQAKITATFSLVLAAYATMLQPIGWMSCASNLLLALVGLFFMLRPGWSGPGWASMLGSYAAFVGSQSLAHVENGHPVELIAMLWFLPPLWILFVIPGLLGRYRENLSERSRAWFAGINNALFFILFNALWADQFGSEDLWKVSAMFGFVLLAIGIVGRRQDTISGGVNISQGLAVGTLALIMKFDGHQLGLILAAESLSLAIAAWKFKGRSEVVFSLVAGLISAWLLVTAVGAVSTIPIWSLVLTSMVVAAASAVMVRVKPHVVDFQGAVRVSSFLLFLAAVLIANHLCVHRLDDTQGMMTAGILASALTAAYLKLDSKRYQPEAAWASMWFLLVAVFIGNGVDHVWANALVAALLFSACWLWHRQPKTPGEAESLDLTYQPAFPAWAFALGVPIFIWQITSACCASSSTLYLLNHCVALALLVVATRLRCERLSVTSAIFSLVSLSLLTNTDGRNALFIFISVLLAFAAASIVVTTWSRKYISEISGITACCLFRLTAFLAFMIGFYEWSPDLWGDWVALSAAIVVALIGLMKWKCPMECLGWILVSLLWLFYRSTNEPWGITEGDQEWRGGMVVLALVILTVVYKTRPACIPKLQNGKNTVALLAGLMCVFMASWATQMLVWRFDWKPAAVLWTSLGFLFVSMGLWQRVHILRVSGFVLLALSLTKIFISDVWDYTAFMRVASFIILGLALILLGLFYNKFSHVIKTLLESEHGKATEIQEERAPQ